MAGQPKANIDWNKVSDLLKAQCNATGIAEILGISTDTLYRRCKSDNNVDFAAFSQQKKAEGKELLRAKMYQEAMDGDRTMLVWLSKQYLEMTDKQKLEHSGNEITINVVEKDI